jgi:hypothetical protein
MTIEIRIPKTIDEDSAEWEHYCYVSNINKAVQKLQELFGQTTGGNNGQQS